MSDVPVKRGRGRPKKVRTPEEQAALDAAEREKSHRRVQREMKQEMGEEYTKTMKAFQLMGREEPYTDEELAFLQEWANLMGINLGIKTSRQTTGEG